MALEAASCGLTSRNHHATMRCPSIRGTVRAENTSTVRLLYCNKDETEAGETAGKYSDLTGASNGQLKLP
jgi:ribosomal protein L32